jgi:GLPGLI family protein
MRHLININKLIIGVLLTIIFCNSTYSQRNNLILKFEEQSNEFKSSYNLFIFPNISHWIEIDKPSLNEKKMNWNINYVENENYSKKQVYKDFTNNFIYSTYQILGHNFFVKEKIENLNWVITDSTEVVLGYSCQIAKTKFRGRSYFASFTKEIPISDGPWKFNGLPGLILKVVSGNELNEFYKMECIEIIKNKENKLPTSKNFINKNNFVSWDNLIKEVDSYLKNYIKKLKSDEETSDDGGYSIKIKLKNYKEVFHREAQSYGIMVEM